MKRPANRTLVVLASAAALGVGGATVGIAASGGSDSDPAKALADALNANEGTNLTEADIQQAQESVFKARLAAAVKAGRLTQAQADEMLQRMKDAPKRRAEHEAARAAGMAPVEKLLGMTADEIHAKRDGTTTLAKLAESKGVSRAKLLDAIKEGIRAATKAKGVTFSDERLTQMAERMADSAGGPGFGDRGTRHGGPGEFRGHGGPGGFGVGPDFPPLGP